MAVLINGVSYSSANVKLVLFGVPVIGVTAIEYSAKQKKENNYGLGFDPVSRGYGQKEYTGKITLYREVWAAIIANAPGLDPLDIPMFDIQVIFGGTPTRPLSVKTDVLQACDFLEDPFSVKSNDTAIMIDLPIIIGKVLHLPG